MREYVETTYGPWEEAQQAAFHREWFDPGRLRIIEQHGRAIGVLDAIDNGEYVYLGRIELLPEWQSRGIGSALVRDLTGHRQVRLHVFKSNPRAQALYTRLGFTPTGTENARLAMTHPGPSD